MVAAFVILAGGIVFFMSKKSTSQQQAETQADTQVEETQKIYTDLEPAGNDPVGPDAPITTIKEVTEISLTVTSPVGGSSTTSTKTTVSGKTSPKAEVFANEAEGIADSNGNFSLSVALDEGENSIIVTAVDADGKVAEKEILVTYEIKE